MQIVIPRNRYKRNFSSFILRNLRSIVLVKLNIKKLNSMKPIIIEKLFIEYPNIDLNMVRLFNMLASNFYIVRNVSSDYIRFNPFIEYPGTNIKLIDILNLLTNGDLTTNGCTAFRDTCNFINEHLDNYYVRYRNGGI